jgi:hypothetical protein
VCSVANSNKNKISVIAKTVKKILKEKKDKEKERSSVKTTDI